jgi:predicted phage baseplate assembly protein
LSFPLCISARVSTPDGNEEIKEVSVARGNVALADHGETRTSELQLAAEEPVTGYYSLKLPHKDITFSVPYDQNEAALSLSYQDPRRALPSKMSLQDPDETWTVQRDLLGSDRFRADFLVEIEGDGEATVRFGNGVMGKKPSAGTRFAATYRIGNGRAGNVGLETIARVVTNFREIVGVRNPLPARGGTDPETMEQVRQFAPHAFRTQERAVTERDYAEVTERHVEVQKAAATFRWTGSWYTVFVTIDRKGGLNVDVKFKARIRRHLEKYRIAGYDFEINGPLFVPLDILIRVCVESGYFKSYVKEGLLKTFSRHELPDGQRGFFHPDNFTFGQPVYLSQLYHRAMGVAGVASVEVVKFQRWGKTPIDEKENGFLKPGTLEVIRLDNDPNFQENGKIDFDMHGGV